MDFILFSCVFKQPIIILSAPRSGSTLLFETLAKSDELWTIGGESHAVIEGMPEFSPGYQDSISNQLTEKDGDEQSLNLLKQRFESQLRNVRGERYSSRAHGPIRFLEKTPKNALRIRFLNKVFPDAKFIYLVRDPKENISSMIDAWKSKHFITYPNLPDFKNRWSLLLLPDWPNLKEKGDHEIAAYQWYTCNKTILHELHQMPDNKWTTVNYSDFISNPSETITKLTSFMDIAMIPHLANKTANDLPLSQFTLTKPSLNKWHKNAQLLASQMDSLNDLIPDINKELVRHNYSSIDNAIDKSILDQN